MLIFTFKIKYMLLIIILFFFFKYSNGNNKIVVEQKIWREVPPKHSPTHLYVCCRNTKSIEGDCRCCYFAMHQTWRRLIPFMFRGVLRKSIIVFPGCSLPGALYALSIFNFIYNRGCINHYFCRQLLLCIWFIRAVIILNTSSKRRC